MFKGEPHLGELSSSAALLRPGNYNQKIILSDHLAETLASPALTGFAFYIPLSGHQPINRTTLNLPRILTLVGVFRRLIALMGNCEFSMSGTLNLKRVVCPLQFMGNGDCSMRSRSGLAKTWRPTTFLFYSEITSNSPKEIYVLTPLFFTIIATHHFCIR